MIIVIVFTPSIELLGVWVKGYVVKSEGENKNGIYVLNSCLKKRTDIRSPKVNVNVEHTLKSASCQTLEVSRQD
jgi:hypothetical protein